MELVNYYHKELHLGCCSSPRSASVKVLVTMVDQSFQELYLGEKNSPQEMFFEKSVLKICSKFTGEHPRRSEVSIELLCNFIEITLQRKCSLVRLLDFCRTTFQNNTSAGLLLSGAPSEFHFRSISKLIFSVASFWNLAKISKSQRYGSMFPSDFSYYL